MYRMFILIISKDLNIYKFILITFIHNIVKIILKEKWHNMFTWKSSFLPCFSLNWKDLIYIFINITKISFIQVICYNYFHLFTFSILYYIIEKSFSLFFFIMYYKSFVNVETIKNRATMKKKIVVIKYDWFHSYFC